MKKAVYITLCLLSTACVSNKQIQMNAVNFANELAERADPVETIEVYKRYFSPYDWACVRNGYNGYIKSHEKCEQAKQLQVNGTDIACISNNTSEYDSDKCILFRRNTPPSEILYFDYKRFLPENSPINTEEKFLNLVKKYDAVNDCEKQKETTTTEKDACKEKIKNEIRLLATQSVSCSKLKGEGYTEFLEKQGRWYEYAQNHDPYDNINLLRAVGAYEAAAFAYNPVYSQKEAQKEVQKSIEKYGAENLCSFENWKQDMKKLGYYMK